MPFGRAFIAFSFAVSCVAMVPSQVEAQSFLDKVKDRAKDVIADDEESSSSQKKDNEEAGTQGGASGFSGRAQRFYEVYQSRYSRYPEMEDAFREAELHFDQFFGERIVRCDNEWYVMDDDLFGVLADVYPDTDLYPDTRVHLSKMIDDIWPYVSGIKNDRMSVDITAEGNKSSLGLVEWRTGSGFRDTEVLNGWELAASGKVGGRLDFEWSESSESGKWSTVAGINYRLEKRDGKVDILVYSGLTTRLSKKVSEWATTAWNETHQKIPADFGRNSIEEQCAVLNGIATSN